MITLWKKIKEVKSTDSFRPWLYRIIVNKCYDRMRKKKREPVTTADDKTWALISNRIYENPDINLEDEELAMIINQLTNKLSVKQKTVFVLSEI
jgi:RNA polymerase sigma-70 factor, ECF subfamily